MLFRSKQFNESWDEEDDFDDEFSSQEDGEYYTAKLSNEIKKMSNKFNGKGVIWYGDPDRMIVLYKDQIHSMDCNVYDPDKMKSLVKLIRDHEDKIEIECSYGLANVVEFIDIKEHQESVLSDHFGVDFTHDDPYTTGDEELDKYIGSDDSDEYDLEEYFGWSISSSDVVDFLNDHKFDLIDGTHTEESLKKEFDKLESEEDNEIFDEFIRIETKLKKAEKNNEGDFGKFTVQLRDGHHRVMGAIEAGEEYVCVNLTKEDIEQYKDKDLYTKVEMKG